jgi:N-acetylneuraminic acid mutarotase
MIRFLLFTLICFTSVVANAQQEWKPLANGLVPRIEGVSAVVDNKLYVFGGFFNGRLQVTETAEMYDPQTDTWAPLAPLPLPGTHFGIEVVDNTIWLAGGFLGDNPGVSSDQVQIYDIASNTWRFGPAFPVPRSAGALVRNGNTLHYIGGLLPDRNTDVGDHYILNLSDTASGWQLSTPMPEPRNHLSGILLNGKIYAIGGQKLHDRASRHDVSFVHEYDPATDSWRRLADLPVPRSHFEPGTTVHNNKIIIVGGRINNDPYTNAVTQYDPVTDTWQEMEPIPVSMLAPVGKVINNTLFVSHGRSSRGPESKAWSWNLPAVVTSLPQAGTVQELQVQVFPVPASGQFTIAVTLPKNGTIAAELLDLTGRVVRSISEKKANAITTTHINIATTDLRPGLYLARVFVNGQAISKKVVLE